MAMAKDKSAPTWRDFAAWSAVGAVVYILAVCAGAAVLNEDGVGVLLRERLRSGRLAGMLGLGLALSMALTGFTSRKRPFSLRHLRNFVIRDAVAIAICLLVLWCFGALARAGALTAMGVSEWVAAATGAVLIGFAVLGALVTASARTGADLIDDELAAEELRDRGRMFLYSFVWVGACGLLLIGLSLAGPGGALPPTTAVVGALVLVALLSVLGVAVWRLLDELGRTLSYEAGNMAFYLVVVLGCGWAMLAHLGFVAAPAPLDWLTMVVVLMFAASFIATGRRKLLGH